MAIKSINTNELVRIADAIRYQSGNLSEMSIGDMATEIMSLNIDDGSILTFYLIDSKLNVHKCYAECGMMWWDWIYSDYNLYGYDTGYGIDENGEEMVGYECLYDSYGKQYVNLEMSMEIENEAVYIADDIYKAVINNGNEILFVFIGDGCAGGEKCIYKAREGMTWEQWVNSEYGNDWSYGYYDWPAYDCLYSNGAMAYVDVQGNDIIEAGGVYTVCEGTGGALEGANALPVLEFQIEFNEGIEIRYAVQGMTWREWVNSSLNIDGFYIDEDRDSSFLFYGDAWGFYVDFDSPIEALDYAISSW